MTVPGVGDPPKGRPRKLEKIKQMIEWIRRYQKERGFMPHMEEVGQQFGYARSSISHILPSMLQLGLLRRLEKPRKTQYILGDNQGEPKVYPLGDNIVVFNMPSKMGRVLSALHVKAVIM